MKHLVLLGDSILDNSPYTAPAPDTSTILRTALGSGWTVDLLARDGSTMSDLSSQLRHLAAVPAVGVLSIGGNDAIGDIDILTPAVARTTDVLERLIDIVDSFAERYGRVVADIRDRVERLIVCTIYEPPLDDPRTARLARVPLSLLNDQIIRTAVQAGVDVLDLRTVCTDDSDFVNQIEPSAAGAEKIARAIDALARGGTLRTSGRVFAA